MDPRAGLAGWETGPRATLGRVGEIRQKRGGGGGFLPSPFPEREGGTDPCPSSQEWQLTPRAGHSCSDSSVAFARHVPGKFPLYPSQAVRFKVPVTQRVLQLHGSLVPMCVSVPTGVHAPGCTHHSGGVWEALRPEASFHVPPCSLHPPEIFLGTGMGLWAAGCCRGAGAGQPLCPMVLVAP